MPPLTEIELEIEQNDPHKSIDLSSFLDETSCSVPDLEEIPNPDMTNVPSFLGQNYKSRNCTRVLRPHKNSSAYHHIYTFSYVTIIFHMFIGHPCIY